MAIQNEDLLVLQKGGGGELRKASVAALLAEVAIPDTPTLDEVTTAGNNSETAITIGPDGAPTLELKADGGITAKSLDVDNAVTAGTSITAASEVTSGTIITAGMKVHAGSDGASVRITLDGLTGEIGGGADVYIDGGTY